MKNIKQFINFINESLYEEKENYLDLINDRLLDLEDLNFKVKEITNYYLDINNKATRVLKDYKKIKFDIILEKSIESYSIDASNYYKSNPDISIAFIAIDNFCNSFNECYFDQYFSKEKFRISFFVIFDLSKDSLKNEIKIQKKKKAEESTNDYVNKFYKLVYESLTSKFEANAKKNLLGETNYSIIGVIKEGFLFRPLNMNVLSKGVINTNISKINYWINSFTSTDSTQFKPELRKVTIQDLEKTRNDMIKHNYSSVPNLEYFTERYLDIDALFLNFNYKKLVEYFEKY